MTTISSFYGILIWGHDWDRHPGCYRRPTTPPGFEPGSGI